MKLLILGIDGGDPSLVRRSIMPTQHHLLETGRQLDVREDLWSRGWAEILSGEHGRETGAFYSKPALDGTHAFTQSFRVDDYRESGAQPIWDTLSQQGIRVGMMNFPSTMPAPEVLGFAVSGAGSGFGGSGLSDIPPEACYPPEVAGTLSRTEYIFDTRLKASGLTDSSAFLQQLERMQQRRAEAFVTLCEEYRPDVGMVAFMGTTRIQYAAYRDVEWMIERPQEELNDFQRGVSAVYSSLDSAVAHVVERLEPEHVMLVSDHGAAPFRGRVNLNVLLREIGLQQELSPASPRRSIRRLSKILPAPLRSAISNRLGSAREKLAAPASNINWERSAAFAHRYVSGVYLNDARFQGPVSDNQRASLVETLVDQINASDLARDLEVRAEPYRATFPHARRRDLLPDVWIDAPDSVFFERSGPLYSPNPNYDFVHDLSDIQGDIHAGIKGKRPLLRVDVGDEELVEENDPSDLTLVHRIAMRILDL